MLHFTRLTRHSLITRRTALRLASTSAIVAACRSGTPPSQEPAGPGPKKPATVRYVIQVGPADFEKIGAPLEEYQRRYPQITIEATNFPAVSEYMTFLQTGFMSGTAPDVIWMYTRALLPFAVQNVLDEVTKPLATRNVKLSDYYDLALEEAQLEGKTYGIPQGWGVGVLGINKTLFQNAGVPLKPNFDVDWTHDEFISMLKQVAKLNDNGDLEVWGTDYSESWPLWWDFGADILDKDKKRSVVNTSQGAQALQWWHDLSHVHRIQPRPGTGDRPQGVDMWTSGRQAILGNAGPFVLAQWGALTFDYDIILRPKGPAPRYHRWYTDIYTINAASKELDAAYDLLAFIVGPEGQTLVERAGGRSIPGHKQIAETVFLHENPAKLTKQKWLEAAKNARKQPLIVKWDEMNAIVGTHRVAVLAQKESPKDAVAAIERELNTLLEAT
jgi:multiple sugar transport system substrate-binding protein